MPVTSSSITLVAGVRGTRRLTGGSAVWLGLMLKAPCRDSCVDNAVLFQHVLDLGSDLCRRPSGTVARPRGRDLRAMVSG